MKGDQVLASSELSKAFQSAEGEEQTPPGDPEPFTATDLAGLTVSGLQKLKNLVIAAMGKDALSSMVDFFADAGDDVGDKMEPLLDFGKKALVNFLNDTSQLVEFANIVNRRLGVIQELVDKFSGVPQFSCENKFAGLLETGNGLKMMDDAATNEEGDFIRTLLGPQQSICTPDGCEWEDWSPTLTVGLDIPIGEGCIEGTYGQVCMGLGVDIGYAYEFGDRNPGGRDDAPQSFGWFEMGFPTLSIGPVEKCLSRQYFTAAGECSDCPKTKYTKVRAAKRKKPASANPVAGAEYIEVSSDTCIDLNCKVNHYCPLDAANRFNVCKRCGEGKHREGGLKKCADLAAESECIATDCDVVAHRTALTEKEALTGAFSSYQGLYSTKPDADDANPQYVCAKNMRTGHHCTLCPAGKTKKANANKCFNIDPDPCVETRCEVGQKRVSYKCKLCAENEDCTYADATSYQPYQHATLLSPGKDSKVYYKKCEIGQYVTSDKTCEKCPNGKAPKSRFGSKIRLSMSPSNAAKGSDKQCSATYCDFHQVLAQETGEASEPDCIKCKDGKKRKSGADNWVDTSSTKADNIGCEVIKCKENESVNGAHKCVACETGKTRTAGDDASGGETTCTVTMCTANQFSKNGKCFPCPTGTGEKCSDAQFSAFIFPNKSPEPIICGTNEHVEGHKCEQCDAGQKFNAFPYNTFNARNSAAGSNTQCSDVICSPGQHTVNGKCMQCSITPGYHPEGFNVRSTINANNHPNVGCVSESGLLETEERRKASMITWKSGFSADMDWGVNLGFVRDSGHLDGSGLSITVDGLVELPFIKSFTLEFEWDWTSRWEKDYEDCLEYYNEEVDWYQMSPKDRYW